MTGTKDTRPTSPATLQVPDPDVRERRHNLCLLIEGQCPTIDPLTDLPIGSEVEALADAILAALPLDGRDVERCARAVEAAIPLPGNERQVTGTYAQGMFEAVAIIRKLAGEGGK